MATIQWHGTIESIAKSKYGNDKVGKFTAETCARYMDAYVPYLTGVLSTTYVTEPWKVKYLMPYAHRQYNGEGFNFTKDFHPLATSKWDTHVDRQAIAREIEKYIGVKGL